MFFDLYFRFFAPAKFDTLLKKSLESESYRDFCQKIYGRDLSQFNILDESQLEILLEALKKIAPKHCLDLACGNGRLTHFLAGELTASFDGLDFAPDVIKMAKDRFESEKIKFYCKRIETAQRMKPNSYDLVLSVDGLYSVSNKVKFFRNLKTILNDSGQLVFFYTEVAEKRGSISQSLKDAGYEFCTIDVSQNEVELWQRLLEIGPDLQRGFRDEGNLDLLHTRMAEAKRALAFFEKGEGKRFLYLAKKS